MTLLQWKEDFISETLHHSTHKLSSCLLVLNLRTLWDLQKPAQGLTLISEGAVAVLNTWLILPWVHAHVWSCSKALGLCTSSGNGDGISAWTVHTQPSTAAGPPPGFGKSWMLGGSKIPGMLLLHVLPVRAPQSQAIPNGFGLSPCGMWGSTCTGNQFTRNLSISMQANQKLSKGSPLPVSPSGECPMSHSPLGHSCWGPGSSGD